MEQGFGRARRGTQAKRTLWVLAGALTILCALSQRMWAQGAIAGEVRYYNGGAAVPGVSVGFSGIGQMTAITDTDGLYAFSDPGAGSCSIEPTKNGGLNNALSVLDATWVLQAVVGTRQFDATQLLACDVTGDGTISALDATRILQVIAGLRSRFPVAEACGSDWLFIPAPGPAPDQHIVSPQMSPQCSPGEIIYGSPLTQPVTAQDFIAAVFGDCTGNWAAATLPSGTPTPQDTATPTPPPPPPTVSNTPTATATPPLPATKTATSSITATRSVTATASRTGTSTRTMTASATATSTLPPATSTRTTTPIPPSATHTFTRTPTVSQTATISTQ
jgi:hypothetical protein